MNPLITHNLEELRRGLVLYQRASGKTFEEVLVKKSGQLGYSLRQEFRGLMPKKGSVRSERLDALAHGEGVHVRQSVYDRIAKQYGAMPLAQGKMAWRSRGKAVSTNRAGMNLQALAVKRELNLRESGRGFMGQSSRFAFSAKLTDDKSVSKYGAWLAKVGLRQVGSGPEVTFVWGGLSSMSDDAVKAIGRARGQAAVARAIANVTADMIPYLQDHLGKAVTAVGLGRV